MTCPKWAVSSGQVCSESGSCGAEPVVLRGLVVSSFFTVARPQGRLVRRMVGCRGGSDQRASPRSFSEALKTLEVGTDLPRRGVYVCPVCGNTAYDPAPDQCPSAKPREAPSSESNLRLALTEPGPELKKREPCSGFSVRHNLKPLPDRCHFTVLTSEVARDSANRRANRGRKRPASPFANRAANRLRSRDTNRLASRLGNRRKNPSANLLPKRPARRAANHPQNRRENPPANPVRTPLETAREPFPERSAPWFPECLFSWP